MKKASFIFLNFALIAIFLILPRGILAQTLNDSQTVSITAIVPATSTEPAPLNGGNNNAPSGFSSGPAPESGLTNNGIVVPTSPQNNDTINGIIEVTAETAPAVKASIDVKISNDLSSLSTLNGKVVSSRVLPVSIGRDLTNKIQTVISEHNALALKMVGDTDPTVIQKDVVAMNQLSKDYSLVQSQTQIVIMANKILSISSSLTTLGVKITSRIKEANLQDQQTSKDIQQQVSGLNAEIVNVKQHASKALETVASLNFDGGDTEQWHYNSTTLEAGIAHMTISKQSIATIYKKMKALVSTTQNLTGRSF